MEHRDEDNRITYLLTLYMGNELNEAEKEELIAYQSVHPSLPSVMRILDDKEQLRKCWEMYLKQKQYDDPKDEAMK